MSMSRLHSPSDALAADGRTLGALKARAGQNTPESIQEAAKQFESLFMRELIKSMREATMKSGLLDSPGGDLGADLLDQQFAVQLSGQPGGLSELIAKQLSRQMGEPAADMPKPAPAAGPSPVSPAVPQAIPKIAAHSAWSRTAADLTVKPAAQPVSSGPGAPNPQSSQEAFVKRHSEAADRVAKASGLPAGFMLGQAGHETGWGRHEIKQRDGAPSFNLFGIKAGANWTGRVAEVTTTEYVGGAPVKSVARFRAYSSYDESFQDYARLITKTPRYAQAKQATSSPLAFASGLQRAGYATDPDYASKLSRAINASLRLQRAQA
ncbi:MAG: flagellar assembly peptidoglycan hydrolase FlgJ [Betaproteobacteria bacterium]|nr:flagellar assembly peptidoglycan hydrolase FlgJ [Betaproteobacteria bacterium]